MDRYLNYTRIVLSWYDKIYKDNITVSGVENIPLENPLLFAANHFTRAETLLLIYIIHKHTGRMVRGLADKGLFKNATSRKYLEHTGTLSTGAKDFKEVMANGLAYGPDDFLMFPQGRMSKDKKVIRRQGRYYIQTEEKEISMPTGVGRIPVDGELIRQALIESGKAHSPKSDYPIAVLPSNISYYPIRPGKNRLQYLVEKLSKGEISERMEEELQIEGNILFGANMHVHFCKPIFVDEFVARGQFLLNAVPFMSTETKNEKIINHYRHRLTTKVMESIYQHVAINLDHIFTMCLYFYGSDQVNIRDLYSRIYLCIEEIKKLPDYYLHESLKFDLTNVLSGIEHPPLKSIFDLALKEGVLTGDKNNEYFRRNPEAFTKVHAFHKIRLEAVMQVLLNEMLLLKPVTNIVKEVAARPQEKINQEIFDDILAQDIKTFEDEYEEVKSDLSTAKEHGAPYFLKGTTKNSIVIAHGFKASPAEVRPMAEFFQRHGYNVYAARLDGHGTAPVSMKTTSGEKWIDTCTRPLLALNLISDNVIAIGFSTGADALGISISRHRTLAQGFIPINAPLELYDKRVRAAGVLDRMNHALAKMHKHGKEYVIDMPENPTLNYKLVSVHAVYELSKVMREFRRILPSIVVPTFVIQSLRDPVVKEWCGRTIIEEIGTPSSKKELYQPDDTDKHVIILQEGNENLFRRMKLFIENKILTRNMQIER